jgi:pyruvate/2-oxoglutarate dehydrogenase complex dihydrolipoamide dehydrogenase (E3) component
LDNKEHNEKPINFSPHAKEKFKRLASVGVTEEKVIQTLKNPESTVSGFLGRKIAQSSLSHDLIVRVIYEETDNNILVVTIYPAKRSRYE